MENQNSAKKISIIALIISIIALLLGLWHCYSCPCCFHRHHHPMCEAHHQHPMPPQPQQEAFVEDELPAQPAQVADEEPTQPFVSPDGATKKKAATAPFIDLGLPSGTKWRVINEDGLLTYDEAIEKFGKQVPSKKQFTELYEKCEWKELKDGGYKVIGPNGNFILFPFTGFINCTGEFRMGNELGDYWTSTKNGEDAYRVAMNAKGVIFQSHPCCYARGIRLVEK